jgi:hypothetical protein
VTQAMHAPLTTAWGRAPTEFARRDTSAGQSLKGGGLFIHMYGQQRRGLQVAQKDLSVGRGRAGVKDQHAESRQASPARWCVRGESAMAGMSSFALNE